MTSGPFTDEPVPHDAIEVPAPIGVPAEVPVELAALGRLLSVWRLYDGPTKTGLSRRYPELHAALVGLDGSFQP